MKTTRDETEEVEQEPVSKKIKIDNNSILLKAVKKALDGKELDETYDTLLFFPSIINCDGEQINTDTPSDGNRVLKGSDLTELQYLVLMAVGYQLDEIQVDNLPVSLVTLLQGWCSDSTDFYEDSDNDEPEAEGCRRFSNNKETYGCLHGKFIIEKNPMHSYRVIRAGI
jgi:hypothetical protein